MLRSLFTGISGLTAHQQMLDVTANNIANVNTTGFKASSTVFQDTLSQTISGASAANDGVGGRNAQQIGLGVRLAGTEMNMGQGSNQATGVGTDLMLNGDGFFVVEKNGQTLYTRAGAFHLDNVGQLVTPDGSIVQGYAVSGLDGDGNAIIDTNAGNGFEPIGLDLSALTDPQNSAANPYADDGSYNPGAATKMSYVSYSVDPTGRINAVGTDGNTYVLGQITVAVFANPNGLTKIGNTQFQASPASGQPTFDPAAPHGEISSGYLEMSNSDLSLELTNLIIAQRGFQANSKSVTTADQILQTLVTLKQ